MTPLGRADEDDRGYLQPRSLLRSSLTSDGIDEPYHRLLFIAETGTESDGRADWLCHGAGEVCDALKLGNLTKASAYIRLLTFLDGEMLPFAPPDTPASRCHKVERAVG